MKIFASARSWLIAVAMVAGITGCYRGPTTDDPDLKIVPGSTVPYGVLTPSPASGLRGRTYTGIYAMRNIEDPYCCWLARSATFQVRVPAKARQIVFAMFIPDLDLFHERKQEVDISVDGRLLRQYTNLDTGLKLLDVPIPARTHARIVRVDLRTGFTFIPFRHRINKDGRRLSIYLKHIVVR